MKFGVQFDFHKIPEWSEFYFNYKALKKLLKQNINRLKELETPSNKKQSSEKKHSKSVFKPAKSEKLLENEETPQRKFSESRDSSNTLESRDPQDEYFISWRDKFIEYLNVVNSFYKSKYLETREDFDSLKQKMSDKKREYVIFLFKKVEKHSIILAKPINEYSSFSDNSVSEFKKNIRQNVERDELGYAVSWKRAFSHIYNITSWLQGYCTINKIACQKILKKFRKHFIKYNEEKAKIIYEELTELSMKQLFCQNSNEMDTIELRIEIKDFYADYFTKGNQTSAIHSLQSRMRPFRKRDIFALAFNSGMIIMQIVFFMIAYFSNKDKENSIENFFPCFSFTLMIILCFFGLAINVIIFRKYRINYIYIFEVDPNSRLTHTQILKTGLTFFNLWFLLLNFTYANLHFHIFYGNFYIYAISILILILLFLVWPFHCFYFTLRLAILKTFRNNIFPIGAQAVKFRDFMFGDLLTSLTRPFNNLTLTICLITCNECLENNYRKDCKRNDIPGLIVNLLPFIIRFFQCLNRYYYTRMAWPNLANALKYSGGIVFVIISWLYSSSNRSLVILVGLINSSYLLFWDVRMDWNLGYIGTKYFFLRDKLLYPIYFYYLALILNLILRFTWLYNFYISQDIIGEEAKIFIFSILEIYRRTQWALFRVENENQNNFEKYRTFLEIPELPVD